jgi:hypothetical protein
MIIKRTLVLGFIICTSVVYGKTEPWTWLYKTFFTHQERTIHGTYLILRSAFFHGMLYVQAMDIFHFMRKYAMQQQKNGMFGTKCLIGV